ncbi:HEPN domain-containing protein [Methanocella arvoryzae]|uniref:HEPN domain-containing protein n=1 Tax=Methanocella arvoryzae TaxID=1175445 RepID=UPI0009DA339B
MSSLAEARAVRYLLDASYDKSLIDAAIKENIPSLALFHMEQLCEKSTKACLAILSILITKEHGFSYYVEAITKSER